ncbi:protein-L-isoaspartate(D-aspartate) O-methyltransferase [Nocardiopsis mwathae]|uniref:Protein-L-isoaspartate O-methyltransferase n=1 Tax=Nocardiopsis mwathae TaxID=1472723 RepID=A0A7W9YGY1_9ACTN|nr:methyltransferase domain-containing protein [Nocardiopsis mwathae]MBB6171316.1 protein-L-isoaspartate(D-aspartate) O-methyltransferase [Nocardiopsis mwathae]
MSYSPAVRTALEAVDEDYYTLRPDGNLVTQSTACWLIAATLDTLDVRPGMRVLEIGTGSGFSGALLSELVGPVGTVVSVDVVPGLIERARELHARQGRANIQLLTDDGGKGAPGHGTFDRIVAWTTPDLLPQAWADQAEPGAVIITPVRITGRARTNAILTASVAEDRRIIGESLAAGGYVEMHSEPLDQWLVPPRGADALIRDADGNPWWISAAWAEDGAPRVGQETGAEAAARLLEEIAAAPTTPHRQLNDTESDEDFTGYLYAGFPDDITVIGMGTSGWHVGYADADGAAVLRRTVTDGVFRHDVVHYGTQNALDTLRSWVESWRAAGRPGYGDLQPVLRRTRDGWETRAVLREDKR